MREHASDLIGAYVLGAVDARERRLVERWARHDPAVRAELADFDAAVAAMDRLSDPGSDGPGPGVWRRIEAEIAGDRDGRDTMRRRRRAPRWLTGALAVAAVTAISLLTVRVAQLGEENRTLRASLADPIALAVERAMSSPSGATVSLGAPGGVAASVSAVLQADGTGYVLGDDLPPLEGGRTYQLWVIVDGDVLSAGVMGRDPGIVPFHVDGAVEGLAITDEVAGGVVTSQNQPVAVWIAET